MGLGWHRRLTPAAFRADSGKQIGRFIHCVFFMGQSPTEWKNLSVEPDFFEGRTLSANFEIA